MRHVLPEEVKKWLRDNPEAIRCKDDRGFPELRLMVEAGGSIPPEELVERAPRDRLAFDAACKRIEQYSQAGKIPQELADFQSKVHKGEIRRPGKPGRQPETTIGKKHVLFRAIKMCAKAGIGTQPACDLIAKFLKAEGIAVLQWEAIKREFERSEKKLKELLKEHD